MESSEILKSFPFLSKAALQEIIQNSAEKFVALSLFLFHSESVAGCCR